MTHRFITIVLIGALASAPLFIHAQTDYLKQALMNVVESLEQATRPNKNSGQEAKNRKTILRNILQLAAAENSNLINKLIKLKDLSPEHTHLRDRFLKELGNHSSYYETLMTTLEKETSPIKIKQLANQFRDWRQIVYHPTLRDITGFLLVFETRDTLTTAERRLDAVTADLERIHDLDIIRTSPLPELLAQATHSLTEARALQTAAEAALAKAALQTNTKKIIETELAFVRDAYTAFGDMSAWIEKNAENNTTPE